MLIRELFGKKFKDLTKEEQKQYLRILNNRRYRKTHEVKNYSKIYGENYKNLTKEEKEKYYKAYRSQYSKRRYAMMTDEQKHIQIQKSTAWRHNNRERSRKWYAEHRRKNREKLREYDRNYKRKQRAKLKEQKNEITNTKSGETKK